MDKSTQMFLAALVISAPYAGNYISAVLGTLFFLVGLIFWIFEIVKSLRENKQGSV